MTDAEKAWEWFNERFKNHHHQLHEGIPKCCIAISTIHTALHRAAECEKAYEGALIQSDSYKNAIKLVNKQADDLEAENKSLKDKAQGLLDVAMEVINDCAHYIPAPPWEITYKLNKGIAAFKADDLGVVNDLKEFYHSLPILLDQEYTSYSPNLNAHHEIFWENIYQAFKQRLEHEGSEK